MTCREAQDRMAGGLAGVLPEEEREAYRAHLGACAACRSSEARLGQAWGFLEGLETPPLPLDLAARIRAAAGKAPPSVPVPRLPAPPPIRLSPAPLLKWWRPATALLGLGALAWGIHARFGRTHPPGDSGTRASATPLQGWRSPGPATLRLTALPQADLWASPGARGAAVPSEGRLVLDEGMVWGRLLSGESLKVEAAGWTVTVTRGAFSVVVTREAAAFTCHEGFLKVEEGPGFSSGPAAVPERTSVLLLPGRPPVGPRPARALYPGEPEEAPGVFKDWRERPPTGGAP